MPGKIVLLKRYPPSRFTNARRAGRGESFTLMSFPRSGNATMLASALILHFEDCPVITVAAIKGGANEIALAVHDEAAKGDITVAAGREGIERGNLAVGRHPVHYAGIVRAAVKRGAVKVAL